MPRQFYHVDGQLETLRDGKVNNRREIAVKESERPTLLLVLTHPWQTPRIRKPRFGPCIVLGRK